MLVTGGCYVDNDIAIQIRLCTLSRSHWVYVSRTLQPFPVVHLSQDTPGAIRVEKQVGRSRGWWDPTEWYGGTWTNGLPERCTSLSDSDPGKRCKCSRLKARILTNTKAAQPTDLEGASERAEGGECVEGEEKRWWWKPVPFFPLRIYYDVWEILGTAPMSAPTLVQRACKILFGFHASPSDSLTTMTGSPGVTTVELSGMMSTYHSRQATPARTKSATRKLLPSPHGLSRVPAEFILAARECITSIHAPYPRLSDEPLRPRLGLI